MPTCWSDHECDSERKLGRIPAMLRILSLRATPPKGEHVVAVLGEVLQALPIAKNGAPARPPGTGFAADSRLGPPLPPTIV